MMTLKAQKLQNIDKGVDEWKATLSPRSSAWSVMELVSRLFPENSGVLVRSVNYDVTPLPVAPGPGAGATVPGAAAKPLVGIGFKRVWKIDGIANDQGTSLIDTFSNEKVAQVFASLAKDVHQPIFDPAPTRSVQTRPTRNAQPPVSIGGKSYNAKFSIVIEQSVMPEDELAFPKKTPNLPQPAIL
jgi:hypothetical protein